MQPRRHRGPAGCGRAVLPARPGHSRGGGAGLAGPGLYRRHIGRNRPGRRARNLRAGGGELAAAEFGEAFMTLATVDPIHRARRTNGFDVERARADFPILSRKVHGKPLVYLDSAASAQKPRAVIDTMTRFMEEDYANIHRGVHFLSQRSTDAFEAARAKVARFLNAAKADEIIFTRNATESINLVAQSWGRKNLGPGDEIVLTELEHHANIVPWQMLRAEKGFEIKVAPIDDAGQIRLDDMSKLIGPRTKLVAISHMSNALGTILPVREIIRLTREVGALVLLDGCQAIVHKQIDVQALD